MAQSLCKIYLHIIFHVKTTSPQIAEDHLERLHSYIGKLVNTTGCQVLCVGGIGNHVLSSIYESFAWQGGYAAFSISQSQVDTVIAYIRNQVEHHKKQSFHDEYLAFLRLYKIEYDERYVLSD